MSKRLIIYGYNRNNLGDDLMFAEIINKTNYQQYYFIGEETVPAFVTKNVKFIKQGRLMPLRWKWKSDFAVIGGSVLMGANKAQESMILQKTKWFKMNKIFGGRNFIVGANLGPFSSEQRYLSLIDSLNRYTDKWFVRDSFSETLLNNLKTKFMKLMPDIVMGLCIQHYNTVEKTNSIAISVTQVDKDGGGKINAQDYYKEIELHANYFLNQGKTINFLSFEDTKDLSTINHIAQALGSEHSKRVNVIENKSDKVLQAIAKAEAVISTRFHSMVLAALFNKPQIIYSYSEKTQQFADSYGFKTYSVTGEAENKVPIATQFSEADLANVSTYGKWVEQ